MWFKNIHIFNLPDGTIYDPENLINELTQKAYEPCGRSIPETMGWVAPMNVVDAPLVHAANGFLMICLKIEEKLIPASVVNDKLVQRLQGLEQKDGRKISRREKMSLKDEIYFSLIPQAFSKISKIYAYIDAKDNRLVVDSASRSKAEVLVNFLRKTLGNLRAKMPETIPPGDLMTRWLQQHDYPKDFRIEDSCVLQDGQDRYSSVRCQRFDLLSDHVRGFLDDGCEVVQMALSWRGQIRFTLKDDLSIARIKFLDTIQDMVKDIFTETEQQRFDADFSIMTETLRQFIRELMQLMTKSTDSAERVLVDADVI